MKLGEEVILTLLWQSVLLQFCFFSTLMFSFTQYFECAAPHRVGLTGQAKKALVLIVACLQTHTSIITVSVTWLCSPLGLELMVKIRPLLTVFNLILKAEAHDYGKGRFISYSCFCCSANHNALGQLVNQCRLCLSEGWTFLKTKCLREARHRGPTIMYSIWKIMCFF